MWCDVMWCDVMWCDVMWCDVMWCDVMWCDVMWCDVMWCDVMWYDMIWYDMIYYDILWYDMVWYGMVWYTAMIYDKISILQYTVGLYMFFFCKIFFLMYTLSWFGNFFSGEVIEVIEFPKKAGRWTIENRPVPRMFFRLFSWRSTLKLFRKMSLPSYILSCCDVFEI